MTTTVLVADDDLRVRRDFVRLLGLEHDITVVGQAVDGVDAVTVARARRPDVTVMDIRMPVLDGIAATELICRERTSKVLVMTTLDIDAYVLGAIRAGASGFLVKNSAVDTLADAIRTIADGNGIVSPRATARLLAELATTGEGPTAGAFGGSGHEFDRLSRREREIVALIANGSTNKDIADVAHISQATAKTHVSHILTKLGVVNRVQIALWAHAHGLAAPSAGPSPASRSDPTRS